MRLSPCLLILIVVSSALAQQPANQTAAQKFKNIQIFKELPAAQLDPTMAFISGALGVKCNYCHVNQFDKDEKPTKLAARRMIQMVFDLNKGSFNGQGAVSCYTCHRGKPTPVSIPAIGENLWSSISTPPRTPTELPTAEQILARYVNALGGTEALAKITSRVAKGSRIGADGILVPEQVYQKAPDKILTVTSYPTVVFSSGFNGKVGWGSSSKEGPTPLPDQVLAQLKADSVFNKELKMDQLYSKLKVEGRSTVRGSEAYVIEATAANGLREKLFFDTQTGLLVRRYVESNTILGPLPLQTDYEDFREIDGVKQPFLIHWSLPGRIWGRKITEVSQNVPIGDSKFDPITK